MNSKKRKLFKDDVITQAVDKCNDILNEFGLCVGKLAYINEEELNKHHNVNYKLFGNKLVKKETFDKLTSKGE